MNNIFENTIRVRYGETDQMGVVYYGNYALYLEVARTELIRSTGLSYQKLEEEGFLLPVVNLNINYRRSAKYDEEILLKTKIIGPIDKKICFETEIFNPNNKLLCIARVELIFVQKTSGKVCSCPEKLQQILSKYQWE